MTEEAYLATYNIHDYDIPLSSVDVVIFTLLEDRLQVLLVKRGEHPSKGMWSLPGGFVDIKNDRSIEETALRKLRQKTGAKVPYLEQLQAFGSSTRDPRGWSMTCTYFALIFADSVHLHSGSGAEDVRWWPIENSKVKTKLAFDHADILKAAVNRLQNKVEYTSLPVHLLPKEFTLTDLQQVYEIILGKSVDKSAFRKRTKDANFLEEIAGKFRTGSNRPAQLYRIAPGHPTVFFPRTIGTNKD